MTFSFFSQIVNDRKKFFFFNRKKKAILECFKTNNACCSVIFISFCCLPLHHDVILTTTFLHSKIHNSSRNIYKNVVPIFFSFLQRRYHNFQYTIANSDVVYLVTLSKVLFLTTKISSLVWRSLKSFSTESVNDTFEHVILLNNKKYCLNS